MFSCENFNDFEGSSDNYIPSSSEGDSSSNFEDNKQKKKKLKKKEEVRHVTADETRESETSDNDDGNFNNMVNNGIKDRYSRGRKKTKEGESTRKRKRDTKTWEKNIRKKLRMQGKDYYTIKRKKVPKKEVRQPCKCRMKCYEKVLPAER